MEMAQSHLKKKSREDQIAQLKAQLQQSIRHEIINRTLFKIGNSINTSESLHDLLFAIHKILGQVMDTTNFYVALQNAGKDSLSYPYFADCKNPLPPNQNKADRFVHLTRDIIRTGQPLLLDEAAIQRYNSREGLLPDQRLGSKVWLGVPLQSHNKVIGAIVVQSYQQPELYSFTDMEFLTSLSKQIAMAIDHRKKEERLRESEDNYRVIFENSPLGITHLEHTGHILTCNERLGTILGLDQSELIGKHISSLLSPVAVDGFNKALRGRKVTLDADHILARGSSPRHLHITFNPIYPNHSASDLIATFEDITEQTKVKEKAKASAEQIKVFFSSLNDAIFVHPLRQEGFSPFIEVNDIACERYGYTRDEFLHLTAQDITDAASVSEHARREHRRLLLERGQLTFEAKHIKKSGESFPVEINANVTHQFGKKVILAVARDISERNKTLDEKRKLEGQLLQAQKMEIVGRLAGGVAHDFNNMLSVILGHTELILEDLEKDSLLAQDIQVIEQAAEQSSELTRQLLAFARKQAIAPRKLDVNAEIENMLDIIRRMIGEDIELIWQPVDSVWPVLFDPSQIDQIITNLCINARDAIPDTGKITIQTENRIVGANLEPQFQAIQSGEYVLLTVADTGTGIDKSALPHIFEPFYTTKEAGKGTGLGLATVYGILKQNKGYIYAASLNNSTVFSIFIPRFHGQLDQVEKEMEFSELRDGTETILLVEDENAILQLVATMLSRHGYQVIPCNHPIDALKKAAENPTEIDVIITDIVMPEMNGRDLAQKIRYLNPRIKCLYMSGYTTEIIAHDELIDDEVQFLQKPFTKRTLLQKLQTLLS